MVLRNVQFLEDTRTLIGNGYALDSGLLAAHAAYEDWNIMVSRCTHNIGITHTFNNRLSARYSGFRKDAEVTTSRILAEIYLDAVSFGRHSARFGCG